MEGLAGAIWDRKEGMWSYIVTQQCSWRGYDILLVEPGCYYPGLSKFQEQKKDVAATYGHKLWRLWEHYAAHSSPSKDTTLGRLIHFINKWVSIDWD